MTSLNTNQSTQNCFKLNKKLKPLHYAVVFIKVGRNTHAQSLA